MSINQSQVDHILSSASADDPEVKLQNLQDEVDLLKKSVKRLLIDIRERMNELENPFILASAASTPSIIQPVPAPAPEPSLEEEKVTQAKEPVADIPVSSQVDSHATPEKSVSGNPSVIHNPYDIPSYQQLMSDEAMLKNLQQKLAGLQPETDKPREEKLHLQKLHQLFEWTNRMVKKYGHDRLEIMMQSYRTMGYIEEDAFDQVIEIARLMPESLGECHEIGSKEFVSELYILNRILSPNDASLDREMIEVLMAMHNATDLQKEATSDREGKTTASTEDWIKMLDRI
ncbi:hypothetical protein AZH53_02550 [Methanomicrobiaceae archaeon CYW5]|uniref:hypothetical protein n=1 Tax=Methanovulcanius yangii TaxID=1789227 RepID=UPI0029CA5CA4|nr:hypothetical protein [Methanovulcanius yangii]MBT8507310.1 hypothetical protein [Methanovulcanius yangii]